MAILSTKWRENTISPWRHRNMKAGIEGKRGKGRCEVSGGVGLDESLTFEKHWRSGV